MCANFNGVKTVLLKEQSKRTIQIPFEDLKRVATARSAKRVQYKTRQGVKHATERLNKATTQRYATSCVYNTYIINVGSINIDHT